MRFHLHRTTLVAMAVLLAGSWLAASSHPQPQRSPSAQADLRAAMDKETVDGDLSAAITLYRAIVDRYVTTDRATAATALVHIGECYQRLGDKQARAAFERILRDFGDVSEAAAAARTHLAVLGAAGGSTLSMRRVYSNRELTSCGGISSDGRYVTSPFTSGGTLDIVDVRSGQVRQVNVSNGTAGTDASVECAVFSPDDRQVAFGFRAAKDSWELRVLGIDGTGLRTVIRGSTSFFMPLDWSSDGRQILTAVYPHDGTQQLMVVSVATGTTRVLKSGAENGRVRGAFSPDGRYVAYSVAASDASKQSDVFVVSSDGTGDTAVVRHPADDALLGWSPDGETVFFSSDRTGAGSVWSIEVVNGQPRGTPVMVKGGVGTIDPIRLVGGTLYHINTLSLSDVLLASFDAASGTSGASRGAKSGLSGTDYAPDWSPDGRSLAYRSIGGGADPWLDPPALVSILNVQSGEERQVRPALGSLDPNDGPRWSPDGRSLLVIARYGGPQHGVYRIDAQTGATTPLIKVPAGQLVFHAVWSRDGRSVFYAIGAPGPGPARLVRRDLASGRDVELVSMGTPVGLVFVALSPDGERLAFTSWQNADAGLAALNVISIEGGAVQPLYRAPIDRDLIGAPAWSPDGRYVYFRRSTQQSNGSNTAQFWRVGSDGRGAEKIPLEVPPRFFAFSPDGRTIAFTKTETRTELWALENLAPKKAGR